MNEKLVNLQCGNNGILHWNKANPFTQNYAQFIDNVNNPKFLVKQMRVSTPNRAVACGGADYAHHSTMSPTGFSDLATALPKEWSMAFKMATKMLQLQSKLSLFRKII